MRTVAMLNGMEWNGMEWNGIRVQRIKGSRSLHVASSGLNHWLWPQRTEFPRTDCKNPVFTEGNSVENFYTKFCSTGKVNRRKMPKKLKGRRPCRKQFKANPTQTPTAAVVEEHSPSKPCNKRETVRQGTMRKDCRSKINENKEKQRTKELETLQELFQQQSLAHEEVESLQHKETESLQEEETKHEDKDTIKHEQNELLQPDLEELQMAFPNSQDRSQNEPEVEKSIANDSEEEPCQLTSSFNELNGNDNEQTLSLGEGTSLEDESNSHSQLNNDYEALKEQTSNLQKQLDEEKQQKSIMEQEFKKLQLQCSSCQDELTAALKQMSNLQKQLDEEKQQKSIVEKEFKKLQLQYSSCQDQQTAALKKEKENNLCLEGQLGECTKTLLDTQEEVAQLKTQLKADGQQASLLVENLQIQQKHLEKALDRCELEITTYQQDLDQKSNENLQMQHQLVELQSKLREQEMQLKSENEGCKEQISNLQLRLDEEKQQKANMDKNFKKLQCQYASCRDKQTSALNQEKEKNMCLEGQLEECKKTLHDTREKTAQLRQKLKAEVQQAQLLTEHKKVLEETHKQCEVEIKKYHQDIDKKCSENAQMQKQLVKLKGKLREQEVKLKSEPKGLKEQIHNLQKQLDIEKQQKFNMDKKFKNLKRHYSSCQSKRSAALKQEKEKYVCLEGQLEECKKTLHDTQEEVARLQDQLKAEPQFQDPLEALDQESSAEPAEQQGQQDKLDSQVITEEMSRESVEENPPEKQKPSLCKRLRHALGLRKKKKSQQ